MNEPKVSVIIPTLNRQELLIGTLRGFCCQDCQDFEVIIIDQSDLPPREHPFEELENRMNIFYLEKVGSHRARNYGVKRAKGEILLFVDDDVAINDRRFIKKHLDNYSDPQVGLVVGRVVQPWEDSSRPARKVSRVSRFLLRVSGSFNCDMRQMTNAAIGANFSCRKSIYLGLGGLDPGFQGTASLEDVDFSLRVARDGWKVFFDPEPALKHLAFKTGGQRNSYREQAEQFYWFFNNYIYLFSKHGKKIFFPLFLIYLVMRGAFYVVKYRSLKIFSYSCLKGIYDGIKRL